ncbi:Uma2 family endonuclease [Capilliphycus salinus ALCB114379]|uniref:Uma2 family endonuclease n=1 Tax=Capilliphycus salinus TaxID=2768948 RepID=UPI0039A72574
MNTTQLNHTESLPLVVQLHPVIEITDEQFFEFCQINRELRIERTAHGELVIMSPTGSETEERNFDLIGQLWMWTKQDGTGVGFGSSGGFTLPNGAVRSPDAAWIKKSRWEAISSEQRQKFAPICPDFVVELRSASDRLKLLQEKMQEYIENGAELGWLIDPIQKQVYVYRPEVEMECLENPATVSGDPVLSGFVLDLSKIWSGISETET